MAGVAEEVVVVPILPQHGKAHSEYGRSNIDIYCCPLLAGFSWKEHDALPALWACTSLHITMSR